MLNIDKVQDVYLVCGATDLRKSIDAYIYTLYLQTFFVQLIFFIYFKVIIFNIICFFIFDI